MFIASEGHVGAAGVMLYELVLYACPNGVDIPHIFDLYNEAMIYNSPEKPRKYYSDKRGIKEEQRADKYPLSANVVWKMP
jgi:predicted aldo/keto reductase-like oxidoreductase